MPSDTHGYLEELKSAYKSAAENSFGLFLGAGVNLPTTDEKTPYTMYRWLPLLEELYKRCRASKRGPNFEAFLDKHGDNWSRLASKIQGSLSEAAVATILDSIIYNGDMPRCDRYKRLADSIIAQMPTLHAAICFASAIKGSPDSGEKRANWTFKRNPKIGAVLTTNYDYFFGAGWTRYEAFAGQWKVETPFPSLDKPRRKNQRPIYYLHGYLPYRPAHHKEIVLSKNSYERAYKDSKDPDELGFSLKVLRKEVSYRSLIFVGFSFADDNACDVLKSNRGAQQHYAIVRRGSRSLSIIKDLGIRPVLVGSYDEAASAMKRVYRAGVAPQEWRELGFKSSVGYWNRLLKGKD